MTARPRPARLVHIAKSAGPETDIGGIHVLRGDLEALGIDCSPLDHPFAVLWLSREQSKAVHALDWQIADAELRHLEEAAGIAFGSREAARDD